MVLISIIILIVDQLTKYLSVENLKNSESIPLIGDFLQLSYVENRGAAFGLLSDQRIFFIVVTIAILIFIAAILYYRRDTLSQASKVSLYLIVAGAIGNFIDRVRFGYVVDFIDVKFGELYDFPVFNVADMSVVIGTIILAILIFTDRYERRG